MTPSSSPLIDLPPDTRSHVLSFLSLRDCLRYSQVSKQSLVDTLPNLKERRKRQFCERFVYQAIFERNTLPAKCIGFRLRSTCDFSFPSDDQGNNIRQSHCQSSQSLLTSRKDIDGIHWHMLPSMVERMQHLYRYLPTSHTSKEMLWGLLKDLETAEFDETNDSPKSDLQQSFDSLKLVTKAHRLHEMILAKATCQFEPPPGTTTATDKTSMTLSLEQYMGDVRIACYLIGHILAGIIEGRTTHQSWYDSLGLTIECDHLYPILAYKQWVYLHSSMLRSLPMTPEQVVQLRLFPDCGIQDEITFFVDGNDNDEEQVGSTFSYIEPHLPFSGILSSKNVKMLIDVMKMGMADHLQPFEHRTICNHFGPLGPSFRGRDRVESMSMHLCSLTRDFKKLSCTPCLSRIQDFDLVPEHTGPLYRWFRAADGQEAANIPHPEDEDGANTGFVSSSWMLRLSRECYRNRPMNVEPPLVTLECYLDN